MSNVTPLRTAAPDSDREHRVTRRRIARIWRRIRFGVELLGWLMVAGLVVSFLPT